MDVLFIIGVGLLAVFLVGRHIYKSSKGTSSCVCNGCSSCDSDGVKKES